MKTLEIISFFFFLFLSLFQKRVAKSKLQLAKEEGKKKRWRFLKLEQMQELMPENDSIETTAFEGITVREREGEGLVVWIIGEVFVKEKP